MKLALIGVGQAGGKIADKFIEYDKKHGSPIVQSVTAINTARGDLEGLEHISPDDQLLIGQAEVKGHGVGADNELASTIFSKDSGEVQGALDSIPVHGIDAFVVIAGLGGGTGSGGAPVVARQLKRVHTEPVYGLGILPGSDEGGIYSLNAARSLKTVVDETDHLFVFDNDAWRQTAETVQSGYEQINQEIVRRFGLLFRAGEIHGDQTVAESIVDSSEIINTFSGGGIASIGYADTAVEPPESPGLLGRLRGDDHADIDSTNATNRITSLVRKATLGRLTLPCEIQGVERGLLVVAGPPPYLNRKGIERSRQWLEEQTGSMEIRGGDFPTGNEPKVATVVVLAGVTQSDRLKELQQVAVEAQDAIDETAAGTDDAKSDLIENDELDSLF